MSKKKPAFSALELAHEHLETTATTDAADRRQRSALIAQAAAAVAQAEALWALAGAMRENTKALETNTRVTQVTAALGLDEFAGEDDEELIG